MAISETALDVTLFAVEHLMSGEVATYGDIASVTDVSPRQVGAIMATYGSAVAWWRVVNHRGTLPPHLLPEARDHWLEEGIRHKTATSLDLVSCRVDRPTLAKRLAGL